ncbi:UDP-glucose 4-epimerase GalE [Terasakiella pusilla]|uniref:UDP-glucose 4-epimerase GalE n=1 Tax=Terasakiella pusilla TaxID=64973 RepID=UPI003AA7C697
MDAILVTGGAGYIGSHICLALSRQGYLPIAYDNLSVGNRQNVIAGFFEEGDIRNQDQLSRVMQKHNVHAVIHCAGAAYVGESMSNPEKYYDINVHGTLSLLSAMRSADVTSIIFSSTCAVYGAPETLPITEETPCQPINVYGRSKLMAESLLSDFSHAYGFRSLALRYFNAGGCDKGGKLGEWHDPEPHIIPRILMAAERKIPFISILGDDWPTKDGTCIRDYLHVEDIAGAHVNALTYIQDLKGHEAINLGSNKGYSVRELIDTAEAITGLQIPVKIEERRTGDPAQLIADFGKAEERLRFSLENSSIENIISTAWQWRQGLHES